MKILSFDISSTCIGYAVLEFEPATNETKFISVDYIKPIKEKNIILRIANTRDKIKKIIEDTKPDHIAIEEIVKFMKGSSSANTIIMLTTFNRMIGLLAYDYLQKSPTMLNVLTIRHCIKKEANLTKLPDKEDLPQIISKLLNFEFKYEYNRNGKPQPTNMDRADALCCGLTYIIKNLRKNQLPLFNK